MHAHAVYIATPHPVCSASRSTCSLVCSCVRICKTHYFDVDLMCSECGMQLHTCAPPRYAVCMRTHVCMPVVRRCAQLRAKCWLMMENPWHMSNNSGRGVSMLQHAVLRGSGCGMLQKLHPGCMYPGSKYQQKKTFKPRPAAQQACSELCKY